MPPLDERAARRQRIIAGLQGRGLEQAVADSDLWADMKAEADSAAADRLVSPDLIQIGEQARSVRLQDPHLGLFFSTDDVIIVPGFLGSELDDVTGGNGLIWIDPKLVFSADKLLALKLNAYDPNQPDSDAEAGVAIRPNGAIPLLYSGLKWDLEVRRYEVQIFGFDWRKDIEEAAADLAGVIRDRANRRFRPLHLIAHSQGTVVARRAVQLVGADLAHQLVSNLVLLGPATAGTFSAAFAIAGNVSLLETVRRYGIQTPAGLPAVLQSMTGLYQLLPWRTEPVNRPTGADEEEPTRNKVLEWVKAHAEEFGSAAFWKTGVDANRLELLGWGKGIDATFFNDRTTIILGDHPTVGGVKFVAGKLIEDPDFATDGDGTVPDALALVDGVARVYKAKDAEHMMLPATLTVIATVRDVLAGRTPRLEPVPDEPALAAAPAASATKIRFLAPVKDQLPSAKLPVTAPEAVGGYASPPGPIPSLANRGARDLAAPSSRRLRVFSFDPLLGTDLDALGTDQLTLSLPWTFADGDHLLPGPVGEYLEVVDYDPAEQCFYPPVDLNHPYLLAQDGLSPSEGEPRFHQQMVYAVAMNTIHHFEAALGRSALWGLHLIRDEKGEVIRGSRPEDEYVQRLRIYPHALRQANAYYHPDKKALLFGYFPAQGTDVGENLPGGTVFACLSFDIVAHETTHALLDGLHRYFTEASNPDVYAFHEAFADVVALFQHFSHHDVLWNQIARTHGDIKRESTLGVLAAQFGEALGQRGALRQYLGKKDADGKWIPIPPDPMALSKVKEPHARGAILVAALFRAFTNIYETRVQDLRRIATGGSGILPDGDLPPDLVSRLAKEASKAAQHMLRMCIRALDYIPPVDITFGEYLRALITSDFDLVRDDDRRYRVAVVAAFRDWGVYPDDVRSLSVESLLWRHPDVESFRNANEFFAQNRFDDWNLRSDRRAAFLRMRQFNKAFHDWLRDNLMDGQDQSLGLALGKNAPGSIRREMDLPVFEVHSFRPSRRMGWDGQERIDIVVEIVQRRKAFFDNDLQQRVDQGQTAYQDAKQDFYFRGGCTLLINPSTGEIRYCVAKAIQGKDAEERLVRERRFRQGQFGDRVGGIYIAGDHDERNPFAFLHGGQ